MKNLGTLDNISRLRNDEFGVKGSEFIFEKIFNNSPAAWLIIDDATGIILGANAAATELYGYSCEELRAMKFCQLNCLADEGDCKLIIDGKPILLKHKLKNGLIKDVQAYPSSFQIGDGNLLSVIIIDVTDRKIADDELQNSRNRLAIVVDATQAGIWEWDKESKRLTLDKQCMTMLGYEDYEFGGSFSDWEALCHPEDIARIIHAAEDYVLGKSSRYDVECRLRHKDGTYRWIRSTAKILYHDGRPVSYVGSYLDITVKKRMETSQLENARKLRDFIQVVSDVSFIIDEDGRYIEAFGHEDMFPIPSSNIPGLTINEVVPEQAEYLLEELRKTLAGQVTRSFKNVMELPKGKRTLITRMALMNYIVDGKRMVAISVVDVTEQEKARNMLQACYELRRRSDILNDLLTGTRSADEETMNYIKSIGLKASMPLFCCVINLGNQQVGESKTGQDSLGLEGIQDIIINELNGVAGCVTWGWRGEVGVVCHGAHSFQNHKNISSQLAKHLQEKIFESFPKLKVTIGIGEIQKGLKGFGESLQQAWDAIVVSRCHSGVTGGIFHYRDLGIFQLLLKQSGHKRASDYIAASIGKLISYDNEKGTNYIETLDIILQFANLKQAANKLFLHHNTMVFRKRRIEEILGVTLNDFETKLTLATAIKMYKIKALE